MIFNYHFFRVQQILYHRTGLGQLIIFAYSIMHGIHLTLRVATRSWNSRIWQAKKSRWDPSISFTLAAMILENTISDKWTIAQLTKRVGLVCSQISLSAGPWQATVWHCSYQLQCCYSSAKWWQHSTRLTWRWSLKSMQLCFWCWQHSKLL